MAKQMNGVKITVEDRQARYTFDALEAHLSSTDGGVTTHLSVSPLRNKHLTFLPEKEEAPVTEETKPLEPTLTAEQEAGLKVVLQTAKSIERLAFINARAIERVVQETRIATQIVSHDFNTAVLEALHAGLTQEAIEKHLIDTGFSQLDEKVESVHDLDTDVLYAEA